MDLEQYYILNRVLLSMIGLWPYDDFKVRQLRFILTLLTLILFTSAQLMKLFVSKCNLDLLVEILPFNMIFIAISVKYVTVYVMIKNIKEFQERLQRNWYALTDNREIDIIRKQAIIGRLFTIAIIMFACGILFSCFILQYISILLDIVIPLNESRPRELLFPAEYFIDQQKYFPIVTIHAGIGLFVVTISIIATESFSLANALHAFGLFEIASYRMKHILRKSDSQMCITKQYIRHRIIAAVDFHRRAIEYSELLKASFGRMYLVLFVVMVCSTSINLFNFSRTISSEKILDMIKCIFFIIVCVVCLTLANYAGQKFIDYDTHYYRTICNTKWYNAPLKTQKLILFLIQKTTKCYKVDAGGMFSPCFEGLATSFSMTISYFMVLSSI
ncbi:odorant receptor 63a-like [Camponotus floridanus]|uniref:odorant receptor 63a-like n=1 Tax=Camponotus floridanus TaxID=104421 RepID=UPI000DC67802|nr:odorant receptor 63a-like [Camponotus floridanus]